MAVKCILTGQTPSVLDGVTENVQTQIDNKQDKITITGILQGDGQGNITAVESIGAEVVTLNKSDVGLGNVDNTSDANKPISTATQTALDDKQSKITVSGILKGDGTGTVTAAEEAEAELVDITPDTIGAASKEYVDSIATGTTLSVTLASASWTGTAVPYTYTISNSAITATSTQELSPVTDITADQLSALQAANIIDGGQAAGSMTLKAFGEKPAVDIPVRIIVKG